MMRAIRRGVVRVVAAVLLAGVLVALPAALVRFVGWPLPHHVPAADEISRWLTSPLADNAVLDLLAVAAWLLWAAFLPAVAAEAAAARRGTPTPASARRTGNPLRLVAATLIAAITLGTLTAAGVAAAATAPGAVAVTSETGGAAVAGQLVAWSSGPVPGTSRRGPATFVIAQRTYTHVVERGDTLSGIARDWLGDASRWPQICTLNWHQHWPGVGGRLTDCDLIYPGWTLRLPDDATPPAAASPSPQTGGRRDASASPNGPTSSSVPRSSDPSPTSEASSTPEATPPPARPTSAPGTPAPSASPTPSASDAASETSTPTERHVPDGGDTGQEQDARDPSAQEAQDGVTLPGGFVPWSLASSIAAAVALVWLQRRRRHRPGQTDDDPTDLPPPVSHLHRAVARRSSPTTTADLAERAADVPDQVAFPPGGVGLVGDGAHAAARAALAAVLSSGGPRDPDRRGEAVIDGSALTSLIGTDAAAMGPWPRLHVADDTEHALAVVEEMLLHRARIMDDHAVNDLDALRAEAPDEEALPPVLLITESPAAGTRMRMKTALALGRDVQVTAILLGTWEHGLTVHIDANGRTRSPSPDDPLPDTVPARVGVLDTDTAVAVLATLREAQTGRRPAIRLDTSPVSAAAPTPDALPVPLPEIDTGQMPSLADSSPDATPPELLEEPAAGPPPDTAATEESETDTSPGGRPSADSRPDDVATDARPPQAAPTRKARLRVLGSPEVLDVTEPGKRLRTKALELAVFLACHPDGADARGLSEHLEPGVRLRNAEVRTHTNVYNLRHVLGRAAGPRKMGYITKTAGVYRLDPATVDVDLWTFRSLISQAALAPPEHRPDLLRQACTRYTAPLADGCDYDWIEPHREKVRQEASTAHILLAEELIPTNPQEAADLLDRAITLDTYNEELYRLAMRARHALDDRDGIRHLLHTLTVMLADLDAEPDESTIELAQQLRSAMPTKARPHTTG